MNAMTKDDRAKLIDETIEELQSCVDWELHDAKARKVLEAFADKLTSDAEPIVRAVADLGSCDLEPDTCYYSSGPHCGAHEAYEMREWVPKALAWLATYRG
jgi:hypothetical protein